ncbi:MAG TPA: MmgE/PrpD family protein [Xanthobacteraceae bacterium]|jgi:2-methylcitrate dehydratase PrpD
MTTGSGTSRRIVGFGNRTSATLAALADGTLAHAFDDTHDPSLVHPQRRDRADALAVGEMVGASGKEPLLFKAAADTCGRMTKPSY